MGATIPKKCKDKRPCFARQRNTRICTALSELYEGTGRMCPFCKRDKEITNGVTYPYNKYIGTSFFNAKPRSE